MFCQYCNIVDHPSKHDTLTQSCLNAGSSYCFNNRLTSPLYFKHAHNQLFARAWLFAIVTVCGFNKCTQLHLLTQLNWQTFEYITHYRKDLMVFKALNNQSPTYLTHLFHPACTKTHHSLRYKTSN